MNATDSHIIDTTLLVLLVDLVQLSMYMHTYGSSVGRSYAQQYAVCRMLSPT